MKGWGWVAQTAYAQATYARAARSNAWARRAPPPTPALRPTARIGYAGADHALTRATAGLVRFEPDYGPPFSVNFLLDLFKGSQEQELSHQALRRLLDCLTGIHEDYLRAHPEAPSIYAAGVRYKEEPPGVEEWQDIPTTIQRGYADCEELACWRTAELRVRHNIPARSSFSWKVRPDGGYLYHVVTLWPDGRIEDPSRVLGMK